METRTPQQRLWTEMDAAVSGTTVTMLTSTLWVKPSLCASLSVTMHKDKYCFRFWQYCGLNWGHQRLLGRHFTTLDAFCFKLFLRQCLMFLVGWPRPRSSYLCFLCQLGWQYLVCPQAVIILISRVTGIIGISHCTQLTLVFFYSMVLLNWDYGN
jgi:hypothetical protein